MKVGDVVKFTYEWVDAVQPIPPKPYYEYGVICKLATGGGGEEMATYVVTNCEPDNRFSTLGHRVSQYTQDLELISESR